MKPINETPISSDAAYERETVINFCDAEKKASYYTRNRSRMQELRNLAAEYPDDVISKRMAAKSPEVSPRRRAISLQVKLPVPSSIRQTLWACPF